MTDTIAIDIDLPRDLGDFFRDKIVQLGYDEKGLDDPAKSVRTYLSVSRRLVSLKPRRILRAKDFVCPPNFCQGLNNIESTIRSGGDLTPHLSDSIEHRDYQDQLHLHWGIHHLHLGATMQPNGFIKRTKYLLFCRFDDDSAYLIAVLPHKVWTKQSLVTTLHDNWPDSIGNFRLRGVEGDSLEDKQIRSLRKRNMNYCIEMEDGIVYAPIGGGVACSGDNTLDVIRADRLLFWAEDMQQKIISDFKEVEKRANKRGIFFADPAKFKLSLKGKTFFAVEVHSGYSLPLVCP